MEDTDAQSQLKKRARRRLVGAVVFASVVAVVLPMIMDHQPRQTVQDVEIRIPGQDEKPFAPRFAVAPVEKDAPGVAEPAPESKAPAAAAKPAARPAEAAREEPAEKAADRKTEKAPEKAPEKPVEKPAEKPAAKDSADAKRAAAILAGQGSVPEAAPANAGEFVILIGAFANEENVRNLRAKLAEKNIRTYVEPLDTPGGRKTRVRAGPFPSREAADKALEKMKQVGISGVVAGK
jgi:DedD protein